MRVLIKYSNYDWTAADSIFRESSDKVLLNPILHNLFYWWQFRVVACRIILSKIICSILFSRLSSIDNSFSICQYRILSLWIPVFITWGMKRNRLNSNVVFLGTVHSQLFQSLDKVVRLLEYSLTIDSKMCPHLEKLANISWCTWGLLKIATRMKFQFDLVQIPNNSSNIFSEFIYLSRIRRALIGSRNCFDILLK